MERKTPTKDIYPVTTVDRQKIYHEINNILGSSNPFAKFNIGSGFFAWSDNSCQWHQMIAASDLEQSIIRSAVADIKTKLTPILGEQNTEMLFTIPDDSYIYYNYDGDEVKVLITGWGYKKPIKHDPTLDMVGLVKPNPVSWSFHNDGMIIPNHPFGIKIQRGVKRKMTNAEGIYYLPNLQVGQQICLVDYGTGKEFDLTIVSGQSHYDFDITTFSLLKVNTSLAGAPLADEPVTIEYNGKSHSTQTNIFGCAEIRLPYHLNEIIRVKVKDQTQNVIIQPSGNELNFELSAAPQSDIEVVVSDQNIPVPGRKVSIVYGNDTLNGTTDQTGIFRASVSHISNQNCNVGVDGYEPQSRVLAPNQSNTFLFNNGNGAWKPTKFSAQLFILGEDNFIGSKYPVKIEYKGTTTDYLSDDEGKVALEDVEDGERMVVTDGLHEDNSTTYNLNSEQREYIFRIPSKASKQMTRVKILDCFDRPVKCDDVHFRQEETNVELTSKPDEDGCIYFDPETFLYDKDITVTINGNNKIKKPFTFTTQNGEYEYVLQELKPELDWMTILAQILFIILLIIVMGIIWVCFTQICDDVYNLIYD